jgi:hypothetical protein
MDMYKGHTHKILISDCRKLFFMPLISYPSPSLLAPTSDLNLSSIHTHHFVLCYPKKDLHMT